MIGFIGIGNMGNAMAASLMKQGYELIIHDINKKSAEKLMQNGAQWAESPKEVALRSSIICTMLPSEIEAEKVVYGDDGVLSGLNPNTIYIDHTTNSPEFIKKTGEFINKKKSFMIDAPVMGDRQSISKGILTFYVGGDFSIFKKVEKLLYSIGNEVVFVGKLGSGTTTKISVNALTMGIDLLMTECFTLAVKSGVNLNNLLKAVDKAKILGENSSLYKRMPETLFKGKFLPSHFFLKLAYKDYRLFNNLGFENKVPTRLVNLCEMEILEAMNNGWENHERVISSTLQENRSKVKLRTNTQIN
ncbi:MAG: hypothetical protein CL758_02610 [Chloroflexi bacterium]|nr:hypothetical protein [Chloroflexota bacterium]|tara:strand:+ start:1757 stop:2665 length:909 start_codon:yes stop_codon:yes gene_type:complete